ncbi:hypothetical protein AB0M10_14830 [Streptomyces sp. NPDC051840]|uniref:hypothetical protein n=1 Tax=unclassified Streptomyces TaxID=2593676 RepID=UPI00344011E2
MAIVPRRIGEDAGLPCVGIGQPGRTVVLVGRSPAPRNPAAGALLEMLAGDADTPGEPLRGEGP